MLSSKKLCILLFSSAHLKPTLYSIEYNRNIVCYSIDAQHHGHGLDFSDEWCQRLTRYDHLNQCISLVDGVYQKDIAFFLIVIFGRILGQDVDFSPASEKWRLLVKQSWKFVQYVVGDDEVDGMPAFVTATRLNLTASNNGVPKV
jgi:hypothetical protein